jgi:hypothetical protein
VIVAGSLRDVIRVPSNKLLNIVNVSGNMTDDKAPHPENVAAPSSDTIIAFIFTEVNALQLVKTPSPNVETAPGIVIDVRLAHDSNA